MCCAIAQALATSMIALLSDIPVSNLPGRLIRNIAGIQFVKANWAFPLTYSLFFLSALIYMEIRSTPRWAVWIAFVFLTLPLAAYLATCLRVGTLSILVTGVHW
jgi:hypothetical protein